MKIDVLGLSHQVKSAGGKTISSAKFTQHFYTPKGEIVTLWVSKKIFAVAKGREIISFSCNQKKCIKKAEGVVGKLTYHNPTTK